MEERSVARRRPRACRGWRFNNILRGGGRRPLRPVGAPLDAHNADADTANCSFRDPAPGWQGPGDRWRRGRRFQPGRADIERRGLRPLMAPAGVSDSPGAREVANARLMSAKPANACALCLLSAIGHGIRVATHRILTQVGASIRDRARRAAAPFPGGAWSALGQGAALRFKCPKAGFRISRVLRRLPSWLR